VANTEEARLKARSDAASGLAFYCARMGDYYYEQLCEHGYQEQADAVRKAWAEGGASAGIAAVSDEMIDEMRFVGTTEECIERLDAQAAAGARLHGVTVMEREPEAVGRVLERLVG